MMLGFLLAVACEVGMCYEGAGPVPPPPSPEEWTFKAELAEPCVYHAREAYRIVDDYGLSAELLSPRKATTASH